MKNRTIISVILILVIFTISCKKESTDNNKNNQSSVARATITDFFIQQTNVQFDGHISMFNDYMQTRYNKTSYGFSFQGEFPSSTSYSTISFNNYMIPLLDVNSFISSSYTDSINLSGQLNNYFGVPNQIKIDGNEFISDFYVPSPVIVSFPNNSNFIFDKDSGISMSLDIDDNNDNQIIVVLQYLDDNASEGDVLLTKTYVLTSQESSFTIPASDLIDFPVDNHNIVLYVGCGASETVIFDGFNYDLHGVNITYLPGIILQ